MAKGEQKGPALVGVTEEQVGKMIAAALQGLPSEDRVKILVLEEMKELAGQIEALKLGLPQLIIETFETEAKKDQENQPEFLTKEQVLNLLANVVTLDRVDGLLAESLKSFFTIGETLIEGEAIKGILTEERVMELIAEEIQQLPRPGSLVSLADGAEGELFDDSLLDGLEIDGRPMTTDDILSGTRSDDGVVTIVTRDGRKLTLEGK